jgi:hypothetical protein
MLGPGGGPGVSVTAPVVNGLAISRPPDSSPCVARSVRNDQRLRAARVSSAGFGKPCGHRGDRRPS